MAFSWLCPLALGAGASVSLSASVGRPLAPNLHDPELGVSARRSTGTSNVTGCFLD